MRKPLRITTPFPTAEEVARLMGVSPRANQRDTRDSYRDFRTPGKKRGLGREEGSQEERGGDAKTAGSEDPCIVGQIRKPSF